MANKLYTDFLPAITPIPSNILLQADPSTGALTAVTIENLQGYTANVGLMRGMGSGIIAAPPTNYVYNQGTTFNMTTAQILFTGVFLSKKATITSIGFIQKTAGVYTANNNNKVGIYSVGGSNLSLLRASANNGNLWKGTAGTFVQENLSSSIVLDPGMYFLAALYNQSAQTTAPVINVDSANFYSTTQFFDVPTPMFSSSQATGKSDLTTTVAISTLSRQSNPANLFMIGTPI